MKSIITAKRKGDGIIAVCQDNRARRIVIESINRAAEKITGYLSSEVAGRDLESLLTARVRETLKNYVEYDNPNNDFSSIARRIPNFTLINKNGDKVRISLKVFHMISPDPAKLQYELLIRDVTLQKRMEELKTELVSSHNEEFIERDTGLVTANATKDALDIAYSFVEKDPIEVSFAAVAIDSLNNFTEDYGPEETIKLIRHVGSEIKNICRDDDIVGHLGEGDMGLVLLDCNNKNTEAVIGRIRNGIAKKPFDVEGRGEIKISLSIAYAQLSPEYALIDIFEGCLDAIIDIQAEGGNKTLEVK